MRIDILTVLPELLDSPFQHSIMKRAQEKGLLEVQVHHLRVTAVLVSAVIFALVHYVGDPNTLPFLPALTGPRRRPGRRGSAQRRPVDVDLHPRRLQPDDHDPLPAWHQARDWS